MEWEIQTAIEKAHEAIKAQAQISFAAMSPTAASASQANQASLTNTTVVEDQPNSVSPLHQSTDRAEGPSGNSPGGFTANHRLKPLKVPTFDGDKTKFEEFWGLFQSLVDQSNEPVNLKMARLHQSLTGIALESIRGLGVSEPEYKEAKEILESKFGGQRRQLRAYMDQLEKMAQLRSNDVRAFERFADLVRITVVKLQTEGRQGELGEGTLHSLLVKKLAESQVERYSRWLREQNRERSVVSLKDWLKEEVRIRVEAVEMAYGLESKVKNDGTELRNKAQERIKTLTFWTALDNSSRSQDQSDRRNPSNRKPPCACCGSAYHGVWSCRQFLQKSYDDRWQLAKEKGLCFRCLAGDHHGRDCERSSQCQINGCRGNHHRLLHEDFPASNRQTTAVPPATGGNANPQHSAWEGADTPMARAMTTCKLFGRSLFVTHHSNLGEGTWKKDRNKCNP